MKTNEISKEIEVFEAMCKQNDALICNPKTTSLLPICVIINENYNIEIIGFSFKGEDKERARQFIFNKILSKKIKGYILMLDSKMTTLDKRTGKGEVIDCVFRTLYTPKKTIKKFCVYKEHKIMREQSEEINNLFAQGNEKCKDSWDLFNAESVNTEHDARDKEISDAYNRFKDKNPKLFGEKKT